MLEGKCGDGLVLLTNGQHILKSLLHCINSEIANCLSIYTFAH